MADGREPPTTSTPTEQRVLIDLAAGLLGRTPESFVLDAARRQAEDIVLDQVFFLLGDHAFAQFRDLVDNSPAPSEQLRTLLQTKAPWE